MEQAGKVRDIQVGDRVRFIDDTGVGDLRAVKGAEYIVEMAGDLIRANPVDPALKPILCFSSRFELVTKEPTPTFKVGDRLRVRRDDRNTPYWYAGKEFTVGRIDYEFVTPSDDLDAAYFANGCELVFSPESELEELVKKANEGLRAIREMGHKFNDEVERLGPSGEWVAGKSAANIYSREFRIKPKPVFEPLITSNGWAVTLDGDTFHIGCRQYRAADFLNLLVSECGPTHTNGFIYVDNRGSTRSTRHGIEHDGHTLKWEDADKILAAAKKVIK